MTDDVLTSGSVILYRLSDLGDEIDLAEADRLFVDSAPSRRRPGRDGSRHARSASPRRRWWSPWDAGR